MKSISMMCFKFYWSFYFEIASSSHGYPHEERYESFYDFYDRFIYVQGIAWRRAHWFFFYAEKYFQVV